MPRAGAGTHGSAKLQIGLIRLLQSESSTVAVTLSAGEWQPAAATGLQRRFAAAAATDTNATLLLPRCVDGCRVTRLSLPKSMAVSARVAGCNVTHLGGCLLHN
jgi:hypothetical protein